MVAMGMDMRHCIKGEMVCVSFGRRGIEIGL